MPSLARSLSVALAAVAVAVPASAVAQGGGPAPAPQPTPPAPPAPPLVVQKPSPKGLLIKEGWTNRFLLGGQWYFRQDDALVGDQQGFARQQDLSGWTPVHVPFNCNAKDLSQNRPSVAWYSKEFQVPKTRRKANGKASFESNNYREFGFLNGKAIGHFGGCFPFEVDLKNLNRGRNAL